MTRWQRLVLWLNRGARERLCPYCGSGPLTEQTMMMGWSGNAQDVLEVTCTKFKARWEG